MLINQLFNLHPIGARYGQQLELHREILTKLIKATDEKGLYNESDKGVAYVIKRWGKHCTSVECENYRKKHFN